MAVPSAPNITQYPVASNQTLRFYWTAPVTGAPFTNYTLTLNPGALVYTVSPGATDYIVSGLMNGTTYTATIYATNENGNGPASSFESAEPGFLANPPDSAAATAIAPGIVVVSWSPPSILPIAPVKYYVVEVVSSDPAENVNPTRVSATPTERTVYIPNLNSSKQYSFRVYTVNSVGYSGAQTTQSISFNDNQGQVQWATGLFASITANFVSYKIDIDGNGNVYILGTASLGPRLTLFDFVSGPSGPGEQINTTISAIYTGLNTASMTHVILVKYNSSGVLQWAVPIQVLNNTTTPLIGYILNVDASGNSIISYQPPQLHTLRFNNFTSIDPVTKQLNVQLGAQYQTNVNSTDVIIVKYNSSGIFQWMTTAGSGTGVTELFPTSFVNCIKTDKNNNIYIVFNNGSTSLNNNLTYFYNAAPLVGVNVTPSLYGGCLGRGFLVKYNAQGQVQWINRITATNANTNTPYTLTIDNDGNILTTGVSVATQSTIINSVVGISSGILTTAPVSIIPPVKISGDFDSILAKFNPNGQLLYATRTWDTQLAGFANQMIGITTDTTNAVYLQTWNAPLTSNYLNSYYSTLDGSNISTTYGPRLQNHIPNQAEEYIIKYSGSFQFQNAIGFYISTGGIVNMPQYSGGIVNDSYNNVYFSGAFRSTMQIRMYLSTSYNDIMVWSTIATTSNYNSTAGFLAKFDSALNFKWLTIQAGYNQSPSITSVNASNYWLAIDNSNNVYATGSWSIKDPISMQFVHASTLAAGNYIQTQPYGFISSFTSTGTQSFFNSYLVKYA